MAHRIPLSFEGYQSLVAFLADAALEQHRTWLAEEGENTEEHPEYDAARDWARILSDDVVEAIGYQQYHEGDPDHTDADWDLLCKTLDTY